MPAPQIREKRMTCWGEADLLDAHQSFEFLHFAGPKQRGRAGARQRDKPARHDI